MNLSMLRVSVSCFGNKGFKIRYDFRALMIVEDGCHFMVDGSQRASSGKIIIETNVMTIAMIKMLDPL